MRQEYIDRRTLTLADYIIKTGSTVRQTANNFNISKSTVHKDITTRLSELSPATFKKVNRVLQHNKAERHLRGGQATKDKYKNKK